MKRILAVAGIALLLGGCASVPMGDAKQDAALKTFTIAPDKAGVYVYRNESMGASIKMDVSVDGKPLGQTAAKTYLYTEVTPGKHTVTSKSENEDALTIEAKAGTLTYVWQEVKMGMLYARTKLHLMPEAEGKKGVLETSLAAPK
jgi:PBP1b-binding outer membrane lipoprotein LpoB